MTISYQEIQPLVIKNVPIEKWKEIISTNLPQREKYIGDNQTFFFSQFIGQILGTSEDEDEYYNELFELVHHENLQLILLSENLDKTIANDRFQSIQQVLLINQKEKGLSVNRFVAFLDGLIPKSENSAMHRHLRIKMIEVFKAFEKHHKAGFNDKDFRRVLVDLIKWSWNHLDQWLASCSVETKMPRVLWYGDASKSEAYFLYYLQLVGCDLILYHPAKKDIFKGFGLEISKSLVYNNSYQSDPEPFPKERKKRSSTVAFKATRQMDQVLHHDSSQLYKSWQFRDYIPMSLTLKTTYDEIFLLSREKAFIRPNFYVENGIVHIPVLFAKVAGVTTNQNEYWSRMHELIRDDYALLINQFPFTAEVNVNFYYHYHHALNNEGKLDASKLIESNWWPYSFLPSGLQYGLAEAISRLCEKPFLLKRNGEKEEDVQLYLLQQASKIPKKIIELLQKFDYSQAVPRIVLYNNEMNGSLSRSDAALLLLLNEMGVDLILYHPAGHNDVEQYITEDKFDVHRLDEMCFELGFKQSLGFRDLVKSKLFKFLGE
ncbi:YceG family protein [Bacillus taeanensis]|uniref:Putative component of 'biosynthetic module' domain-containing protein n=1 Tax=Bacillus taeanensis TaxID=273032 RepID=A0A366Y3K8_9BACI|nr:YceG family protein [Bacillus taeanensis]RBW70993.1 hypothetical protein DS031_03090 [Bacillus taeanensis]